MTDSPAVDGSAVLRLSCARHAGCDARHEFASMSIYLMSELAKPLKEQLRRGRSNFRPLIDTLLVTVFGTGMHTFPMRAAGAREAGLNLLAEGIRPGEDWMTADVGVKRDFFAKWLKYSIKFTGRHEPSSASGHFVVFPFSHQAVQ